MMMTIDKRGLLPAIKPQPRGVTIHGTVPVMESTKQGTGKAEAEDLEEAML